ISVLRKILSDNGHQYIQTVPRRGYRFVGEVREISDETLFIEEHSLTRVVVEESQTRNDLARESSAMDLRAAARRWDWRSVVLISAVALGTVAVAGWGWSALGPRRVASHSPAPFNVGNVTLRTITSTGNVSYGVISTDGQFVVYSTIDEDNRYALWLQRTGNREVLQLVAPTEHIVGPAAISHDGKWIYYGDASPDESTKGVTIYRMPLFGGAARKVLEGVHLFAALSPDD